MSHGTFNDIVDFASQMLDDNIDSFALHDRTTLFHLPQPNHSK